MLKGSEALTELLSDAPDWLPAVICWEITEPTETDRRHVLGQLDEDVFSTSELRGLADQIGGTFIEDRGRATTSLKVEFRYAGVLFQLWLSRYSFAGGAA